MMSKYKLSVLLAATLAVYGLIPNPSFARQSASAGASEGCRAPYDYFLEQRLWILRYWTLTPLKEICAMLPSSDIPAQPEPGESAEQGESGESGGSGESGESGDQGNEKPQEKSQKLSHRLVRAATILDESEAVQTFVRNDAKTSADFVLRFQDESGATVFTELRFSLAPGASRRVSSTFVPSMRTFDSKYLLVYTHLSAEFPVDAKKPSFFMVSYHLSEHTKDKYANGVYRLGSADCDGAGCNDSSGSSGGGKDGPGPH